MRLRLFASPQRAPFPVWDVTSLDYQKLLDACKEAKPKVEQVDLSRLVATQQEIDFQPKTISEPWHPFPELRDKPIVMQIQEYYLILDGHHRLSKDKLESKPFETCYVFDGTKLGRLVQKSSRWFEFIWM